MLNEKQLKGFRFSSRFLSILGYLSFGFSAIQVISMVVGGISMVVTSPSYESSVTPGFSMFIVFYGVYVIMLGLLSAVACYPIFAIAQKQTEKSNILNEIILSNLKDEEALSLSKYKELERKEFWIERLTLYPFAILGGVILCMTIIGAPVGIIMIIIALNQLKKDKLRAVYDYSPEDTSITQKLQNSTGVLSVQAKIDRLQVWSAVVSAVSVFVSILIIIAIVATIGFYIFNDPEMQKIFNESMNENMMISE